MGNIEAGRNKQRKYMIGMFVGVLAVAYVAALIIAFIQEQRAAFRAGYAQACADVRETIVTRLYDEKPFHIVDCGIHFKRTADRTFMVWFDDQASAAGPVRTADRLIGR